MINGKAEKIIYAFDIIIISDIGSGMYVTVCCSFIHSFIVECCTKGKACYAVAVGQKSQSLGDKFS